MKYRRLLSLLSVFPCLSVFAALTFTTLNAPVTLPPFTFAGRLTDAAHVALGADDISEVRAYTADGQTLLAKASTSDAAGTFYNFSLDIPVATAAAEGYVLPGTKVKLVFVDSEGGLYDSVVPDQDAVVGNPGECKTLSAFLGTDANKDGIADEYAELYLLYGQYLGLPITTFEAEADYDGDGQSNLAEYVAGTDPYLAEDVFDVKAVGLDFWPKDGDGVTLEDWTHVTFPTAQGRCYSVYTATSPGDDGQWRLGKFSYKPVDSGLTERFHATGGAEAGACSLYLRKDDARRFWRIVVE